MNKSTIIDLAFGSACYREDINLHENAEYRKNDDALQKIFDKLCKDLPEEEKKNISWDLFIALGGIESAIEEAFFKEGFKLGLRLGAQNFLD